MIELRRFRSASGEEPLTEWLVSLRDKRARTRVLKRIEALGLGNFGDCSPVGAGVIELRVHVGAGYRVYCARHGNMLVLLLCGGDKSTQERDIRLARMYWNEWKKGQGS